MRQCVSVSTLCDPISAGDLYTEPVRSADRTGETETHGDIWQIIWDNRNSIRSVLHGDIWQIIWDLSLIHI